MENLLEQILTGASGVGAYALVLTVLLLCGVGVPLPEDVALITGGFLVYKGAAQLPIMIGVAFIGILGGDTFAFLLGRHLGTHLSERWPLRYIVTPTKRRKVEKLFARYGEKIIVAARFMPGVRAVTYFIGGAARMRYRRFITFDGMAATASAPIFVGLGFLFGDNIDGLVQRVRRGQLTVLLLIAGAIALLYLGRYVWQRTRPRDEPSNPPTRVAASAEPHREDGREEGRSAVPPVAAAASHVAPETRQRRSPAGG